VKQTSASLRRDALAVFRAALHAADAAIAVHQYLSIDSSSLKAGKLRLPLRRFDRIFLVGAGKASAQMASAVEKILGRRLTGGIVVTKHGHATAKLRRAEVIESAHPVPDQAGVDASRQVERLLRQLNARDLLIVAISGGASSLLSAPAEPITLAEKQATTDRLLRAGANIGELNAVRKHLSTLKGGRLAALAFPATVVSLLLSDVIGDPLDVIGSGPTAPDPTTFEDALAVLRKYQLMNKIPKPVRRHLEQGESETPKPGDDAFQHVTNIVIGSSRLALQAAASEAKARGYRPLILSSTMQGETREVAVTHAQILRELRLSGNPIHPPACLLSGGETTVTVRGGGKGGRNQEFALAAAIAIAGLANSLVLSGGTDGTDGPTDAAGAIATGDTMEQAAKLNLNAHQYLADNNSYPFFEALGDLVKTGPTGTNVMDIHILLSR
jgi:hydroxypyruvate reductase